MATANPIQDRRGAGGQKQIILNISYLLMLADSTKEPAVATGGVVAGAVVAGGTGVGGGAVVAGGTVVDSGAAVGTGCAKKHQ